MPYVWPCSRRLLPHGSQSPGAHVVAYGCDVVTATSGPASAVPPAAPVAATAPRMAQISPIVRRGAVPSRSAERREQCASVPHTEGLPSGSSLTESPMFTGEKISLDFQDADINDILRLIAEVGKVNIIAGGDVQGKVTTRMTDVPWDQALDVILKINGLAQERSGNIIRVAPLGEVHQ